MLSALSVYVHWPWCRRICPYCDFNVRAIHSADPKALTDAVCADIRHWRQRIGQRCVISVFFGGGTPSTAPAGCLGQILSAIDDCFDLTNDAEISIEANPNDWRGYADLVAVGINRLSIGVQSLNDDELRFLGRDHDAATARCAVNAASATSARISLDAIYALPEQTVSAWKHTLDGLIALNSEHLSLYQLTISADTAFGRRARRGALIRMTDDLAADFYEMTQRITDTAGLHAYEISNHARGLSARSRHNLVYWRSGDWLGVGPGAHGRLTLGDQRIATLTERDPQRYISLVCENASSGHARDALDTRENAIERLACGLRLSDGIDIPATLDISTISSLRNIGLLEKHPHRLILTPRGKLLTDYISGMLCQSFT